MGKRMMSFADISSNIRLCDSSRTRSTTRPHSRFSDVLGCNQNPELCPQNREYIMAGGDRSKCLTWWCLLSCQTSRDVRNCLRWYAEDNTDSNVDVYPHEVKMDKQRKDYSDASSEEQFISDSREFLDVATRDGPEQKPSGLRYLLRHKKSEINVKKRYRLGLYDCISSYCGSLHGEDRKSCIINYCHRSSTLKM